MSSCHFPAKVYFDDNQAFSSLHIVTIVIIMVVVGRSISTGRDWEKRERGTLDDNLGGYALTLIDSLDMLAVLGDYDR